MNFRNTGLPTKITLLLFSTIFISSCLNDTLSTKEEEDPPKTDIDPNEQVSADGILEAVTWNLEWYGQTSRGPSNELSQTKNILEVMDSLKADLYAVEEVLDNQAMQDIAGNMTGYRGFTSDYSVSPSFSQQTGFIFNTNTIDSVSSGLITDGQNGNDWASGRYPMYFEFNYSYQGNTIPIYAVVIHAKAFDDQESYNRRKRAAESLYNYLMDKKPNANIIFLGDFNDDMDESIYNNAETPYKLFVDDSQNFQIATLPLSQNGATSTVNYSDMIDHIVLSDELFNLYIDDSENVFTNVENFITDYGNTTSDHYPVISKFNITQN